MCMQLILICKRQNFTTDGFSPATQGTFVEHFFNRMIPFDVELESYVIFKLGSADGADALLGIFRQRTAWGVNLLFVLLSLRKILESLGAKITLVPETTLQLVQILPLPYDIICHIMN